MNKVPFLILLLVASLALPGKGQSSQFCKDLLRLINEARTDPQGFLAEHKEKLERQDPSYVRFLQDAEPIPKVSWDKGLEQMAKEVVVNKALDPKYKGSQKNCGMSSGSSIGSIYSDPIPYLCDFYTNVHNPDNIYFGSWFQKDGYAFFWGISCEGTKFKADPVGEIDMSGVDFEKLNTGAKVDYLNELEIEMIQEINFARAYPKVYAKVVAAYLAKKSEAWGGIRHADVVAMKDLAYQLNSMEPVGILQPMKCVYNAAKKHGIDCDKRGFSDHTGSDGSHPAERILAACPDLKDGNENLVSGTGCGPRKGVIILLLDAGISSRGHRHNLLDPSWKYIGCYQYDGETSPYGANVNYIQNFAR